MGGGRMAAALCFLLCCNLRQSSLSFTMLMNSINSVSFVDPVFKRVNTSPMMTYI
jgi:hypothetical protein